MAALYFDFSPEKIQSTEERFYADLANRIPDYAPVGMAYMQQIPFVNTVCTLLLETNDAGPTTCGPGIPPGSTLVLKAGVIPLIIGLPATLLPPIPKVK